MDNIDFDRDRRIWEITNIITPSKKHHYRNENPSYVFPLDEMGFNICYPKKIKNNKDNRKNNIPSI